MILLIPIAIGFFTINFYLFFFKNSEQPLRRSCLAAFTATFFLIAAITELLNIFDLITRTGIGVSWLATDVVLLCWYLKLKRTEDTSAREIAKIWAGSCRTFLRQLGSFTQIILSTLLLVTLLVALIATPNNIDSLCYHLSRLGYWIQNKNVEHYASNIERAISFAPLSEYVHLHTFLLQGSERFFQLVQWLCFVGILGFVSLLTEIFSTSKAALRIALCFAGALPIALLESMTTQNDLVVTFFIISSAFHVVDYVKTNNPVSLLFLAFTVALGIMTKGTFVFYTFPFGIYLLCYLIKNAEWKRLGSLFVGVALITTVLNAPYLKRTYTIFKSPFGTVTNGNRNNITNINGLLSSTSKQVFLHLGFVSPGNRYNNFLENGLRAFHDALGVPLNQLGMPFKMNKLNFSEDFAHNFLAMWMIIFSFLILPFSGLSKSACWYITLTVFSFIIFCFFISYQTYASRIHIPFFMLMSPGIGLIYSTVNALIQKTLMAILWLNAAPFTLLSVTHPLLSTKWFFERVFPIINKPIGLPIQTDKLVNLKQESILFNSPEKIIWGDHWDEIKSLVQYVDSLHAQNIGFDFEEASYDYGFQFVLRNPQRRFQHVLVRNPSGLLEDPKFIPDCIIAEHEEGDTLTYHGKKYDKKWTGTYRWLYVPRAL